MTSSTTNRGSRVTIKDVAAATEKTKQTEAVRAEHTEALQGFRSENPDATNKYGTVYWSELIVDPTIQRPEQPDEINGLVRNYNRSALGMVTLWHRVVPATETETERVELVVVDGQQRRAAGLIVGDEGPIHADIHYGLTKKDAARLFRELNTRKAVNATTLFRTALVEEDPYALAVQAILDGLGIAFGTNKGYSAAKGSVRLIKRTNGATHLHWALRQTQRLWDRGAGGVYDSNVVEALFMLHERDGNRIDEKRLYEKLANDEGSNAGLVEFAATLKRVHKGTTTVNTIRAVIDRYNKGLWKTSRAALPEWGS